MLTEERRSPVNKTGQGAKKALEDGSKEGEDCEQTEVCQENISFLQKGRNGSANTL